MTTITRRYDIDWLRVIAIGLLLVYHVAIAFQPWGVMVGFITTKNTWEALWIPMSMLNVWRIPLLFFVSGMGVYFALQNRNWKQLLQERSSRILLPFVFGMFVIVPVHVYLWQRWYKLDATYSYNPGHLWFLGNIFVYVLLLSPLFFYLKANSEGRVARAIRAVLSSPVGLVVVIAAFVAEALVVNPMLYELYSMTWHGFFLGLLAFVFGFCFVLSGPGFLEVIQRWRWVSLAVAAVMFGVRITLLSPMAPGYLLAAESCCWIFSVLAFGYRHLQKPGPALSYLSQAAYPVYIVHMVVLYLGCTLIFPLDAAAPVQFVLVLAFTAAGCFAFYELVRRVGVLRPLFGLKRL